MLRFHTRPNVHIIALSMHEESDRAAAMCGAGAVCYICKTGQIDPLLAAIRAAVHPGVPGGWSTPRCTNGSRWAFLMMCNG